MAKEKSSTSELQLLTKDEFCEEFNLTISKLNMWIFRHQFPVRKIGGRIYILLKDYSEWLDEHKLTSKKIH